MKPVLIVKHISHENPGLIGEVFREAGLELKIVDLSRGEPPPAISGFSALVMLGGPQSANDSTPQMRQGMRLVEEALKLKIPYLGICLGMQMLIKAAGGKVVKSPEKEIGFLDGLGNSFEIRLTREGKQSVLFDGIDEKFPVFQLHGETVELHPSIALLGSSQRVPNQIIQAGPSAFGFQCHAEITEEMLSDWHAKDSDLKKLDLNELILFFRAMSENYIRNARIIFKNFLIMSGLSGKVLNAH